MITIPVLISIISPFWLSKNERISPLVMNNKVNKQNLPLLKKFYSYEQDYHNGKINKNEWSEKKEEILSQYKI